MTSTSPPTERPFTGPADLPRMREMLIRSRASGTVGGWHVGDLTWRYFLLTLRGDPSGDIRLWEDRSGALAGFAYFDPKEPVLDWQIRPEFGGQGLDGRMLDWIERRAAAQAPESRRWLTGALAGDRARIALLESRGYRNEGGGFVHFERSLRDEIPDSPAPAGLVVRSVSGPAEAARRAAAHREAFHPSRVTGEAYPRLMGLTGYDATLDVVAVAPDGEFASFSLAWLDEVNRIGLFEPVGTRPTFRRLGLAQAVLQEGLRRLKAAGAEKAIVATWAGSDGAIRLYKSIGFEIIDREFDFVRKVD